MRSWTPAEESLALNFENNILEFDADLAEEEIQDIARNPFINLVIIHGLAANDLEYLRAFKALSDHFPNAQFSLDFSNADLTENEFSSLLQTISHEPRNSSITELDFSNTAITGRCFENLKFLGQLNAFSIANCQNIIAENLKNLDFSKLLSFNGKNALDRDSFRILFHASKITNSSGDHSMGRAKLSKLISLDISNCRDLSFRELSVLNNATSLEELFLSGLKFNEESFNHLLQTLPELRVLDISNCVFEGERFSKILNRLPPYRLKIENLNLSGCAGINDEVLLELSHMKFRNLTELDISGSEITDASFESPIIALLDYINVSNCRNITINGIYKLQENQNLHIACEDIQRLENLSRPPTFITDPSIKMPSAKRPRIDK